MSTNALATPASTTTHGLTLLPGGVARSATWYERRSMLRGIVGGCPDHWWTPAARRTAACTCDRFAL
jgi:hypothetical protein